MDLIKLRAATIIVMAITAIIASKDENVPIVITNLFVMFLINSVMNIRVFFTICIYSFGCMIFSVEYIKKQKLYLLYLTIAIAHIIQLVSVLNILFSTM